MLHEQVRNSPHVKTKVQKELLERLEEIYFTLGAIKIMQHDQGPKFGGKVYLN